MWKITRRINYNTARKFVEIQASALVFFPNDYAICNQIIIQNLPVTIFIYNFGLQ